MRDQHLALVVLLLWCVYVVHGIDRTVMHVLLQPISVEFALSDTQVGSLAGIVYILPFAMAGTGAWTRLAPPVVRSRFCAVIDRR